MRTIRTSRAVRRRLALPLLGALGLIGPTAASPASATPPGARLSSPQPGAAARQASRQAARQAARPREGEVRGHRRILIVRYHVTRACVVRPNARRAAGAWTIAPGSTINWRYNVSRTVAAVSDPRGHAKGFPWWGFVTDSGCIGRSVGQTGSYQVFHHGRWVRHRISYPAGRPRPTRLLQGRSQFRPFWTAVDYSVAHGSTPRHLVRLGHPATLRDRPDRFVIGNVFAGWRVRSTRARPHGWTKVYVPALHRWGWVIV
jgi:hypothetical protein